MRENFTNFATTTLTSSLSSTGTSFTVTVGQGALFPTSNFSVCIDTELILIATRSTDTFTVATSGGRAYDGTVASAHTANTAIVQLSIARTNLYHIWQNVADTYHPEVPPFHLGTVASSYDNEFESVGSWTFSPLPATGTTFNVATVVPSHLVFNRGFGDNSAYTAYIPFTSTAAFTVTCKLCDATSFQHPSMADQSQIHFFVSDQSNPAASVEGGNRFRVDSVTSVNLMTNATTGVATRYVRTAQDVAGTYSQLGPIVALSPHGPVFLRITYDGSGNWTGYFGDGIVYWQLITRTSFLTAPQSLGISFSTYYPSGQWMPQTALVDYVRVVLGSVLPPYAN